MYSLKDIQGVVDIIKNIASPKEVYLFGSYAKGNPTEKSDLDIAVIKSTIKDRHLESFEIHQALFDVPISMDILLMEEKELKDNQSNKGSVYYEISKFGKKVA